MSEIHAAIGLLVWVALCVAVAFVGWTFTARSLGAWYGSLNLPSWTPPRMAFGPVWSFLYLTMAVAAWLVWRRAGLQAAAAPLALFAVQLALNAAWSYLFFGLHMPGPAFGEILVLWIFILATVIAFWHVEVIAGVLMLPYLIWVAFAAVLNFAIWRMNA